MRRHSAAAKAFSVRPGGENDGGTHRAPVRRGVSLLAFVAGLLVIGSMVLWMAQFGGTTTISYLGHYLSSGALYASESGIEFALHEVASGGDLDGDGVMGTISNDGNDANDPALSSGSFHCAAAATIFTGIGTWQGHVRVSEVVLN
jgi:hypothetical protein